MKAQFKSLAKAGLKSKSPVRVAINTQKPTISAGKPVLNKSSTSVV